MKGEGRSAKSSKKESDKHSIRENGGSCINNVILDSMGEAVKKNHLFVSLLLALGLSINDVSFQLGDAKK